jgi:hypothetical protein
MHLLVALLVIVVVLYLVFRQSSPKAQTAALSWDHGTLGVAHDLAFLSRGKIFLQQPGADLREIHSPHVQATVDRIQRSRELHAWKQDTAFARSFTGRQRQGGDEEVLLQASTARFTPDGRLMYVLRDDRVGGLYQQDLNTGEEKRLVHRQNFVLDDLTPSADGSRLLASQRASNGSANICLMAIDGSGYRELTGGDTVDTAPAWVPDDPQTVLYQTSGLARGPTGQVLAIGPASIQLLDIAKGAVTPVLEDAQRDFMQPRVGPQGQLYFIRRPYEPPRYESRHFLLDTLAFPFRILRALFHYLNFFSLMYSRKPLTSASGPLVEADLRDIVLKGKRVDAEAALRKGETVQGVPSLVPSSWHLVCRERNGSERVLATHVASFDLADDGCLYYTNGYGVFRISPAGRASVVLRDKMIAEIVAGPRRTA